jgi:hypothetical protein
LQVPARTFVPYRGDAFPIQFVTAGNSETRLRIFDLEGRLVITLFESRFDGGGSTIPSAPTTVAWDGRDGTYELVAGGMYVVHLSVVNNETGKEEVRTAPAVVATRFNY